MLFVRRVTGRSMMPTLKPGDILIARSFRLRVRPGDIVIVDHGGLEKVKRVTGNENGKVFLEGDNDAMSTDSRHYGWLDGGIVRGVVIWPVRRRTL